MIRTGKPNLGSLVSRSALGLALALGVVAGGTMIAPTPAVAAAKAPKLKLSKGFTAAAGPAQKAIDDAKKRPDVAQAKQALDAAIQQRNDAGVASARASLGSALVAEKAALQVAEQAIENNDDRFMYGSLAIGLGSLAADNAIQRGGLKAMLDSGHADPEQIPRYRYFAGSLAYQDKDYAAAQQNLQAAVDAGFYENNAEAILAEAYIAGGNTPQGLAVLKKAIDRLAAAGTPAPEGWYRRGLGASFNAGNTAQAADFSLGLVKAYPSAKSWGGAITVLREIGKFGSQETLDLMRLMGRTNSYNEERDYVEYIQAADPRRLPGEVMEVINAGLTSGKLRAGDTFVADAKSQASGRIAGDKSSLAGYEADARKGSASVATITGAADALLSYGEAAKAADLYQIALGKPGVDTAQVLTRLGIAQVDSGNYAGAQATFAKVSGARKPIAELWSAYAAQKAGGA
ncbi:MAG: hypothetical protein KDE55_15805 [Novosphingobium sp.]|nr:hypothetical protein [Novosphingobium sp.]